MMERHMLVNKVRASAGLCARVCKVVRVASG